MRRFVILLIVLISVLTGCKNRGPSSIRAARFDYNRARTAQEIGLSRQGLFKLIKKHHIEVPETRAR